MKICYISHVIFKTTGQFFFKVCITLQCHEITFLYFFRSNVIYFTLKEPIKVKFFEISSVQVKKSALLSRKRAYQSMNLVKFYVSSPKPENLHFDGILLSKSYKVSAKKEQKSYFSWRWRVIQSLKNKWLVVSNEEFGEFSSNHSKIWKFLFDWFFLFEVYRVWGTYRGVIFCDTEQWCKI